MMKTEDLIAVALGQREADLVLKHAQVFNVFTGQFMAADVAVFKGYIAGVGKGYSGTEEIDLSGKYLTPGFIDGHVHIESSMVSPAEFAKVIVAAETTTAVVDPHEIANATGVEGIKYILAATEELPINIYVMLPSCVPATNLENNGARLTFAELKEFIKHPRVLGLGELHECTTLKEAEERLAQGMYLMLREGSAAKNLFFYQL